MIAAIRWGMWPASRAFRGVVQETAERLGLELKDRLRPDCSPKQEPGAGESSLHQDVLVGSLEPGYHRPVAERAVDGAIKSAGEEGFERTLKNALRELAK